MSRPLRPFLLALAPLGALGSCTDAATRVAEDLEAGAKQLRASSQQTAVVEHVPTPFPPSWPGARIPSAGRAPGVIRRQAFFDRVAANFAAAERRDGYIDRSELIPGTQTHTWGEPVV